MEWLCFSLTVAALPSFLLTSGQWALATTVPMFCNISNIYTSFVLFCFVFLSGATAGPILTDPWSRLHQTMSLLTLWHLSPHFIYSLLASCCKRCPRQWVMGLFSRMQIQAVPLLAISPLPHHFQDLPWHQPYWLIKARVLFPMALLNLMFWAIPHHQGLLSQPTLQTNGLKSHPVGPFRMDTLGSRVLKGHWCQGESPCLDWTAWEVGEVRMWMVLSVKSLPSWAHLTVPGLYNFRVCSTLTP